MEIVDICMPYFDQPAIRFKHLCGVLDGFVTHGYKKISNISICDDGSMDIPLDEESLRNEYDLDIHVTSLPQKKKWCCACTPINAAVRAGSSPFVLLQSPEVYHETPILETMIDKIQDYKDVVTPLIRVTGHRPLSWFAHPKLRPVHYWWCQLMTRTFFEELGGFDESYRDGIGWEDDDFTERINIGGGKWIWAEECVANHMFLGRGVRNRPEDERRNKDLFFEKYRKYTTRPKGIN